MKKLLLFALVFLSHFSAFAATITVCALGCDQPTITDAINIALPGDIIDVIDATHTERAVVINKDITIQGQGQNTTIVQAAATPNTADDGVFIVNAGVVVVFRNLTIQHGNAASSGLSSSLGGGGVLIDCNASTNVTFLNVTIAENRASRSGGAGVLITGSDGTVSFNNCIVRDNTADGANGGGILNQGADNFVLTNCMIINNTSDSNGGGVFLQPNADTDAHFGGCVITGNNVDNDGGGVAIHSVGDNAEGGEVTFSNCTISGNTSGDDGGGVSARSLEGTNERERINVLLMFDRCTVSNNAAGGVSSANGGGVFLLCDGNTVASFNQTDIIGNTASNNGGGVSFDQDGRDVSATFTDCIIRNNTATNGNGGGVDNRAVDDFTFSQCTIADNNAGDDGGGVNINEGSVTSTLTNCTIHSNIAGNDGGGIFSAGINSSGDVRNLDIINCTIMNNSTAVKGGGVVFRGGFFNVLNVVNTIIFNNSNELESSVNDDIFVTRAISGANRTNQTTSLVGNCNSDNDNCPTFSFTNGANISTTASQCDRHDFFDIVGSDAENNGTSINPGVPATDICGIEVFGNKEIGSFEAIVLPVELISFEGHAAKQGNKLYWRTASEESNRGFEIERSSNGHTWKLIGFVTGSGTTNETKHYSFWDESPMNGISYYRLKQIDFDGSFAFSDVLAIRGNSDENDVVAVYPSIVFSDNINIEFYAPQEQEIIIEIVDLTGRRISNYAFKTLKGRQKRQLDISTLNKGAYYLRMSANNSHQAIKGFTKI